MKYRIALLALLIINSGNSFSQEGRKPDSTKPQKEQAKWFPISKVVFTQQEVQVKAAFPGGEQAWYAFIAKNLNREIPIKNKAPKGKYTIIVNFIVNGAGELLNFVPETNLGYGMEDEVIRVFKTSPAWEPAKVNTTEVNSLIRQAVTFVVE